MKAALETRCKWVMAILSSSPRPGPKLWQALEADIAPIEYKGEFVPFDGTEYYREEHGSDLFRGFIGFRGLGYPERLPAQKHLAAKIEASWTRDGRREFNLDIGYMDVDKLVLASFKRGPSKLYLGDGVYADLLLKYTEGRFDPLPWAFPDFKDRRYDKSLRVIRQKLKAELRKTQDWTREI